MKQLIVAPTLVLAALSSSAALAAGTPVRATLTGSCLEVKHLDRLGALKSLSYTCTAKNATFVYSAKAAEPGTGASGHEFGTLVASGPDGTVTLNFKGTRTAQGASKGTWLMGKVTGYKGVRLTRHGTYTSNTATVSTAPGTLDSTVKISAVVGCWRCSGV
jgi:hypothetical protein